MFCVWILNYSTVCDSLYGALSVPPCLALHYQCLFVRWAPYDCTVWLAVHYIYSLFKSVLCDLLSGSVTPYIARRYLWLFVRQVTPYLTIWLLLWQCDSLSGVSLVVRLLIWRFTALCLFLRWAPYLTALHDCLQFTVYSLFLIAVWLLIWQCDSLSGATLLVTICTASDALSNCTVWLLPW